MTTPLIVYTADNVGDQPAWWEKFLDEYGLFGVGKALEEYNAGFKLDENKSRVLMFENDDDKLLFVLRYVK